MDAGQLLLQRGLITDDQLQQVREQDAEGIAAVEAAANLGFVNEAAALEVLAAETGLEFLDLRDAKIDLNLLQEFPVKLIHRELLFPISRENGAMVVATSDPFNLYPIDEAGAATGLSIIPVLAARREIDLLVKRHLGVGSETIDNLIEQRSDDEVIELLGDIDVDGSELSEMAQEASVIRLVNEILLEAIELRASDVHIESQSGGLVIRYRIDGMLHAQPVPPEISQFQAAIISRLKIMARLNIAEKRIHGESMVMRLLDKSSMVFDLQGLGMEADTYGVFSDLIRIPHGIVLVCGPTGSGKTTTLYSSLLEIRSPENKIITTEDPVEYQLDGINQIQVHARIGLTFGHTLRSILRHDPDIVLVGEIRDLETAENAIQASLTGHLVFSTLHTNDAAGAYTRMIDMGVEPFLVASTVEAVMAQRLIRRLCLDCRREVDPKSLDLPPDFPFEQLADRPLYEPVGCRECRQVGYRGRMGIYELMVTTDDIRQLAHDRASTWQLKTAALENGMATLRDDGWRKVAAGHTSVDEVLRITKGDRMLHMERDREAKKS